MKKISSILLSSTLVALMLVACEHPEPDPIVDSNEYAYIQAKSPKRGVSFSWQMNEDFDLLGPAVSWSYNWANTPAASQENKYKQY